MSFTKFCPKCGKDTDTIVKGVCKDCYLGGNDLFTVKDIVIDLCGRCQKIRFGFNWTQRSDTEIINAITQKIKPVHELEQVKSFVDIEPNGDTSYKVKIKVVGILDDVLAEQEKDFILEEFLEGEEYSVDGICYENEFVVLANCKKELFENTFVASRQTIGIELNTTVQSILDQYLPILLQKIGISHGFVHLQFWLDGDSITFGEIHNRPGGSYIGPASAIHLGVRPFRALTSYESFKEEIRQIKNKANRACVSIEILKYPRSGVLHSASFPRITSKSDQLILTHFYDNFGKKVTADIKTTFDYAGLIVTKGATIAESAELAIIIKKETRFDIH